MADTAQIKYDELWGSLLINYSEKLTNKDCEKLIIKNLNRKNIDKIFVFDVHGQVCFSNLKRDSGIIYNNEIFK
jgi:hypothetical protein